MLTYSFSKIGSESLYMYLYKCIREGHSDGQDHARHEIAL